jgi:hypothetical protein
LHAIASRGGIICDYTGRHTDEAGVDSVLRVKGSLAADSTLNNFTVDVQLKATKKPPIEQSGKYSYSLKIKNYDELRSTNTGAPQLLVVLFLPEDADAWLRHNEKRLVTRRCAYWLSLRGAPEVDQGSQTVYIPRANLLSVDALRMLMTRFSKQEVLDYVA